MHTRATAHIDLSALQHNLSIARQYQPNQKILAMVKANAYGHGALDCARALESADALGVASIAEATSLREGGIKCPLILLPGFLTFEELNACYSYQLTPLIHSDHQLDLLQSHTLESPITAWIKLNVGMNRLGFPHDELARVCAVLTNNPNINPNELVVAAHLSDADQPTGSINVEQCQRFFDLTCKFSHQTSLYNSAAILTQPSNKTDWVRPGLMLYGMSPFPDQLASTFNLRPVMTLKASLIAVRELAIGDCVGYGSTFKAPQPMRMGVVAIGYGDGYPRDMPGNTPVLVNGVKTSLIGRVSMDMIAIDVSGCEAKAGDCVTLWGNGLPVETVAALSGQFVYSLVTQVAPRGDRHYSMACRV